MSKRSRLTSEEAKKAGLNAWETPEGRRWLIKALNPNDVAVATSGIPTLHSRNISILNWQGEYSINVPANLTEVAPSYDATMFLFQHPLVFGMSAARPTGTIDMREFRKYFKITRTVDSNTDGGAYYFYSISSASSPDSPISMTRCAQYLNSQVDPSVFKGDNSLAGRRELFAQLTQKSRIAYGGVTIIPTCSAENNSGTLAVCQQIFNPRKTILGNDQNIGLETYLETDFPDTNDVVQNPSMYYGRFQDGAYIPYKMSDPSSSEYKNSETKIVTRSPYFVKNVSFIGTSASGIGGSTSILTETFANFSGLTNNSFKATSVESLKNLVAVRLYVQSFTGLSGFITLSLCKRNNDELHSKIFFRNENDLTVNLVNSDPMLLREENQIENTVAGNLELNNLYFKIPSLVTCRNWMDNTNELANPEGCYWVSEDISKDPNADGIYKDESICPFNGQSLITVHMAGVSNTAPIKMLLRYGVEILLVSSSPYSPFKFMSPRYDESAIKSYARCIRSMKDAYFANSGSVAGQTDFINKLMTLIENDSSEDLNRTLNLGGSWTGLVAAF